MVYGATDTLGDLAADMIGVLIVTICAHVYLRKHDMAEISCRVRLGRRSFETVETD